MRFFFGEKEHQVNAQESGNLAQHYGWCIEVAINALDEAKTVAEIERILISFKENMQRLPSTTRIFFDNAESAYQFIRSKEKLKKEEVMDFLCGFYIPDEGYIAYYRP